VTDLEGQPVAGVRLNVSRISTEHTLATQSIRGVVPDGITDALILIRANAEDATPGTVAATLLDISFTDGAGGPNLVPNGSFGDGTDHWGTYGSYAEGVRAVAADSEWGLALSASSDQDIFIDGTTFPVTAGTDFELSVAYELDGGSPDSVVVSVAFVGVSRASIYLDHVPKDIGGFVTDANGLVRFSSDVVGPGPATIVVTANGNLDRWPATVSIPIG